DPEGVYGEAESVHTLTRLGLKEDNPDAYTILERIKFELEDVEEGLLEAQDRELEDLTRDWVDDNQEIIEGWIKGVSENNGDSIELVTTPWDDALFSSNVDRKSTRLNSSHVSISYAVFCLKKKNNKIVNIH